MQSYKEIITVTQAKFDKNFRLLSNIKTRVNGLTWQKDVFKKYNLINQHQIDQYTAHTDNLKGLVNRLVHNSVITKKIYQDTYHQFVKYPKKLEDHSKLLFNRYIKRKNNDKVKLEQMVRNKEKGDNTITDKQIEEEKTIVEYKRLFKEDLRRKCLNARKSELERRLMYELLYRVKNGWYVVFNTLTVAQHHKYCNKTRLQYKCWSEKGKRQQLKVFDLGTQVWRTYIRNIDREVGIKVYGSWEKAEQQKEKGKEFHTYFAVVERGSQTGRLHIHVIHIMKELPKGCVDPNLGREIPKYREITSFKQYWKYGFSTPIAVRFNQADAYGKKYWRWPCKIVKNLAIPQESKPVFAIVHYMAKYLEKEYIKPYRKESVTWRIRQTRNLGTKILTLIIQKMSKKQLITITRLKANQEYKILNRTIPIEILKIQAVKQLLKNQKYTNHQNSWHTLKVLRHRPSILMRVKITIQRIQIPSPRKCISTQTLTLIRAEGSKIKEKIKQIEQKYLSGMNGSITLYGSLQGVI